MTGDGDVLKGVVKVSQRVIPNGTAPACGGLGAALRGVPLSAGAHSADRSVCLAMIGVVGKLEVTVHRLLSEPVLKVVVLCHHSYIPLFPHRHFSLFSGVSKPFSHRAVQCFGILRGVSPEASRNVVSVRGEAGERLPRCPDSIRVGFPHLPPRSRVVRKELRGAWQASTRPSSRLLVFR